MVLVLRLESHQVCSRPSPTGPNIGLGFGLEFVVYYLYLQVFVIITLVMTVTINDDSVGGDLDARVMKLTLLQISFDC